MKLGKVVRALGLNSNSVIAIKEGSKLGETKAIEELSDALTKAGYENVILVVIEDLDNIRTLNERQMFQNGWIRVEKVRKLITRKKTEESEPEPQDEQ